MRDRARRRGVALAKSHRATPEELGQASQRVKELEQELRQIELLPETKRGESRENRYSRLLRLRSLRADFSRTRPLDTSDQPNSLILVLVMFVASFILCTGCAGGMFAAVQFLQQKPNPDTVASAFWDDMEHQRYNDIHTNYLSPTLRVQYDQDTFVSQASEVDTSFGLVTSAVLSKSVITQAKTSDQVDQATLTYIVTRGTKTTYAVTLVMTMHAGSWGIDDLGAAIDPTRAGVPAPPTPTPPAAPTDTPTGDRSDPRPIV